MTFTKDELKTILSDILECSSDVILDDIPLSELGLDSLKFVSAVVEIESKYDIEILDSDFVSDNFKDVSAICETLKKYFENDLPKRYKCVITDCDGVLWRGISGESGEDRAYEDESTNRFCRLLRDLRKKGILLAICSKNERSNITSMLEKTLLRTDDFAIMEADVSDKSESVSYILNEFGFFDDNAIYIDDNDAELAYIKSKHPKLTMMKADDNDTLIENITAMFAALPDIDVIDRTEKFREQKEREKIHHRTSSPEEYNQILETKTVCEKAGKEDVSRLVELSQRANRFNLTGTRYTANDIERMLNDRSYSIYKLCATDKFGNMGLVVMAVLHENMIESFIMSCRVFGRGFEMELLNKITSNRSENVVGLYHPTGKNDSCKDFYLHCGVMYELR